ncbi:vegetative cell wall protein gp1-like [Iris pallida]|uniref:Vegetative cell wall protein gp1-like n=1 Tax=Iris pallida TaxID=29817 RepID=A0AAX6H292_IRIPA|nr:vegetative cell wall protein gp1-like [Iris pallida]
MWKSKGRCCRAVEQGRAAWMAVVCGGGVMLKAMAARGVDGHQAAFLCGDAAATRGQVLLLDEVSQFFREGVAHRGWRDFDVRVGDGVRFVSCNSME